MKISEELEQLLKNLHLKRILEIYDEQAQVAQKEDVPYAEFLTRLLRAQWHARQESALEWRIRRANLPERWSLETFPFARQPGVNRKQIRTLAELEFIAKAENIVFIGETARGKTGLACGLLLKALENGYRGQFVRAQDLFDEMYASLADRSTRQLLKRLAHAALLAIFSIAGSAQPTPVAQTIPEATRASAHRGEEVFTGRTRLRNRGPACISCHSVAGLPFPNGGTLGPRFDACLQETWSTRNAICDADTLLSRYDSYL